ncbi:MAG: CinA family protein [Acidiferrobacterales bacterium]
MKIEQLATQIGNELKSRNLMLATAESCTGGWVGQVVTSVPGSSHWYDRGFITYSNGAKRELLGVSTGVLARFGAVSEQTARAMAEGALAHSRADVSLAITGIAGPGGGTEEKPVGTVWFAWVGKDRETRTERRQFDGDRSAVRRQAVEAALLGLSGFIGK